MKKIILILLLIPVLVNAQDLELFGYFEPQVQGIYLDEEFYQYQSNKLRVDLEADYDNARFVANYDYITYHGKKEWSLLDFLPERIKASIPQQAESQFIYKYEDKNFLDNANLRLTFSALDLIIGKQQISLGTGYAYNPVDIFNYKSLIDPTYEQPGHNAIRVDIPFGDGHGLMGLYAMDEEWENSTKLVQFKGRFSHFDYSLLAMETEKERTDYLAAFVTGRPQKIAEKRQILGEDIVGELLGLGVWNETTYNMMETSDNYWEFVIGADYTLESQLYIMLEYYQNDTFKSDADDYTLNDWLWYLNGDTKGLARQQIYFYTSYPITDLIMLQNSVIYAVSDESTAIVPAINYNIFTNVEIEWFASIYLGEEDTAFSENMGSGGMLRARIYF
jgi:hypothetical protein